MNKLVLFLLVSLFGVNLLFAQLPTATCRLANVRVDSVNSITFEVYFKNTTTSDTIRYSGGQYHLDFNKEILNGGTGTYSLVASGLPASFALKNPSVFIGSTPGQLRTASNNLPGAGNGYKIFAGQEVLIFKGKLATSAVAIGSVDPTLKWRKAPMANPITKFGHYQGDTLNVEIQSAATFIDSIPATPVELVSFNALVQGRDIVLNWKTATEKNTDKFEIERTLSDAPGQWLVVGSVKASGTSTKERSYTFTDMKLSAKEYTYRLKMVDLDGMYSYSKVENTKVEIPQVFAVSQNYPNPFNPSTKIEYQVPADAKVRVELYNMTGEKIADLINKDHAAGFYSIELNASVHNLPSGVYIFRMMAQELKNGEHFSATKKMVLIK
ncbi:MAG: T9SS type A sorting domain-containing protein [Ignavibacteriales bacterium]|nr:T9SS type A sorting domain-containing protein [Ignavibacteriales bacterium]